jgi:hypothetical protein
MGPQGLAAAASRCYLCCSIRGSSRLAVCIVYGLVVVRPLLVMQPGCAEAASWVCLYTTTWVL